MRLLPTLDLLIVRVRLDGGDEAGGPEAPGGKAADATAVAAQLLAATPTAAGLCETALTLIDDYPEASVSVFKITAPHPTKVRADLIQDLRDLRDPRLVFAGRVLQRSDNGVYQVYTGNLFLCLREDSLHRLDELLLTYHLIRKQRGSSALTFSAGAYFLEYTGDAKDVFATAARLAAEPGVTHCEPELIVKRKTFRPSKHTGAGHPGQVDVDPQWIMRQIRLPGAHRYTRGLGATIAVIDDGIEASHKAFYAQGDQAISQDFLGTLGERALHRFDSEMHGTACASVAVSSDPLAPGVAPEARLIVARTKGLGSVLEAAAITWAADQGADVISCSWGPTDGNPLHPADADSVVRHPLPRATRLALEYAANKGRGGKGCIICFAAGNGNEPVGADEYASNPYVLAIGSSNHRSRRSYYSDYGPELFACFPSSDIRVVGHEARPLFGNRTADRLGGSGYDETDYYQHFGGTSAAAPGFAGVAALVLAKAPHLTRPEATALLAEACHHPLGARDAQLGHGIIDAAHAVELATAAHQRHKMNSPKTPRTMSSPRAHSLHVGVNRVDPAAYAPAQIPPLFGCVADAENWEAFAKTRHYVTDHLHDGEATWPTLQRKLSALADALDAGDICLLTYAGHGSQVPAPDDPEEPDGYDETWLLHDGLVLDNELNALYAKFRPGVRLVVVSDSCHSGTVSRNTNLFGGELLADDTDPDARRERAVAFDTIRSSYAERREEYQRRKRAATGLPKARAFVKLLPACNDQQTAKEQQGQGAFSKALLALLAEPESTKLTYKQAIAKLRASLVGLDQHPLVDDDGGARDEAFDKQTPFEIAFETAFAKTAAPDGHQNQHASGTNLANGMPAASDDTPAASPHTCPPNGIFVDEPVGNLSFVVEMAEEGRNAAGGDLATGDGSRGLEASARLIDGTLVETSRGAEDMFGRAFELLEANADKRIDFIEPEFTSRADVFRLPGLARAGGDVPGADPGLDYMPERPFPKAGTVADPEVWHLGDEFSQLRRASVRVSPDLATGMVPTPSGKTVHVALIDTGIVGMHPGLPVHMDYVGARSFSGSGKQSSGADDRLQDSFQEQQGHGTATAALLAGGRVGAARLPGGRYNGFIGAAPQVRITPLKISESVVLLRAKAFAKAVYYAVDILKVDVISMSMAGAPTNLMAKAVNHAYDHGVVVVSAAGNAWTSGPTKLLPKTIMYPARFARVIAAVGANCYHKPYKVDQREFERSASGETMESCFGPTKANATVIAGYTPNTMWAGVDGNGQPSFSMKGGGTSTATPQIAAAVALWLQHHGAALDNLLGEGERRSWKRVEAVRTALFQSADALNLPNYFGNGIVRASDALDYAPVATRPTGAEVSAKLVAIDELKQAEKADLGWTNLDDMLGLLFRRKQTRGVSPAIQKEPIRALLQAEVMYLVYEQPQEFGQWRDDPFPEGRIDPVLAEALLASKRTSEHLRRALSLEEPTVEDYDAYTRVPELQTHKVSDNPASNGRKVTVTTENVQCRMVEPDHGQYDEVADAFVEEFAVEIQSPITRSSGRQRAQIKIDESFGEVAVLIEEYDEDGGLIDTYWRVPGAGERSVPGLREDRIVEIDLGQSYTRGGGKLKRAVKRLVGKIFKVLIRDKDGKFGKEVHRTYRMLSAKLGRDGFRFDEVDLADVNGKLELGERGLLLLHGTFNTAEGSFDDLLPNEDFRRLVKERYGGRVVAFEMPTVAEGVTANVERLLPYKFRAAELDVMATSRGTLVARAYGLRNPIHRQVLAGGTAFGTPLADSQHILALVNRVTRLLSFAGKSLARRYRQC